MWKYMIRVYSSSFSASGAPSMPLVPVTRSVCGFILSSLYSAALLPRVAANELDNLGDTSTLAEPAVVEHLIENRLNR